MKRGTLIGLICLGFLAVGTGFYVYLTDIHDMLTREALGHMRETTRQAAAGLDYMLQGKRDLLRGVSVLWQSDRRETARLLSNPEQLRRFFSLPSFVGISVIDPTGNALFRDGEKYDLSDDPSVRRALKGASSLSDPQYDPVTGLRVVSLHEPLYDNGEVVAVVRLSLSLDKLAEEMDIQFFNGAGYMYLVSKEGKKLVNSLHPSSNKTFSDFFQVITGADADMWRTKLAADLYNGEAGEGIMELQQIPKLVAYAPLRQRPGWNLVSVVPESAVLVYSRRVLVWSMGLCALITAMTIGACLLLYLHYRHYKVEEELGVVFRAAFNEVDQVDVWEDSYTQPYCNGMPHQYPVKGRYTDFHNAVLARVHEEDRELFSAIFSLESLRGLCAEGASAPEISVSYRFISPDGSLVWLEAHIILLQRGRKKMVNFLLREVTGQKKMEEMAAVQGRALEKALADARQANEAKSLFLSRMSHDIRTPMNGIIGMTAIAAASLEDSAKVKDCLGKITVASRHLLGLINDVLDMSKIESGKLVLTESEFNLADLVQNLLTIIRPGLTEKKQHLSVSVVGLEHERVIGDTLRLQQVFVNIMSNAVKYTPEGGHISLSIRENGGAPKGYGAFEFVFEDDGIGMKTEFLEHIFNPFERADDNDIRQIQGTGLGLAITRSIVHLMNGEIQVQSEPGRGSRFTVHMLLRLQENALEQGWSEELVDLPVLVADDEEDACEHACVILREIGMRADGVFSGVEAVSRVVSAHGRGEDYFAAILDWKMPNMDGVETARRIRKVVGPDFPIIVLSAYDWSEIEKEALAAGVNAFVPKPLFRSDLVLRLRKFTALAEGTSEDDSSDNGVEGLAGEDFSGRRVLLVEDNELNMEIASALIGMTGALIEKAGDGRQALDMIASVPEFHYDIVFMDVQMPVMGGYEATRAIRRLPREDVRSLPIIAMTANAFIEDVRMAEEAGMNGHIAKPVEIEKLRDVMRRWLGRAGRGNR